jgi:hypothetical protein
MRLTALAVAGLIAALPSRAGDVPTTTQVPYRLTLTKHVLVRVKIDGQGPYNFILDTGAPSFYLATAVAKRLNIKADADGWATMPRLEVEGGAVLEKLRGRVEDPFQLEGMNSLNLAGVPLHGVLGFAVLARFRIELDCTRDKMTWTQLDYEPAVLERGGKGTVPGGLEVLGSALKLLGGLLGNRAVSTVVPRGLLGFELTESDQGVSVKSVLAGGPGALAGLKAGDRLVRVEGKAISSINDVFERTAGMVAGTVVNITVRRDGEEVVLRIKMAEGL